MQSKLFYKGMSKIYDLLDIIYFHNTKRSPREAIIDFLSPQDVKILDICTGTASNAINIAKQKIDTQITSIDISKEMLRIAGKKLKKNGLDNLRLLNMDATETTFKDKTFDVILISLILHEIPNDLAEKILDEAKRVLKTNGKILVVEWEEQQHALKKMLFYPIRKLEPKGFEQFLKMDINSYFSRYGLDIKYIRHCDFTKVLYLKKTDHDL